MSEPKKQELANLQAQSSLVNSAKVSQLVSAQAEDLLVVDSTVIHCTEAGLFSLNDLHKASGASESKRPHAYLRSKAGQDFVQALKAEGVENAFETITGGEAQGTYAHKLLAYEYATYLDRAFRLKAMIVLDRATVAQVEQVQTAYKAVVEELGEERAKRLETVQELGNAYQTLNREKFFNSELINLHRGDKRLNKNSPVAQELGLARRNVRLMVNNLSENQSVLTNAFDALESIKYSLEQEMQVQATNSYYVKLFNSKVLTPISEELADIKEQMRLNTKLLRDAEQYMANASNIIDAEVPDDES